jgi:hypothetical protein
MSGMKWTRQDFEESITALEQVLQAERTATAAAIKGGCRLLNWQLQRHVAYNHSILYLCHPSVDRISPSLEHAAACQNSPGTIDPDPLLISNRNNHHHDNNDDDDDDDSEDHPPWLLEDGTIQMDPDCCFSSSSSSMSQSHKLDKTQNNTMKTQWTFSIVYSDTWRVPILYFTVQWYDTGSPCTRTEVLQWLKSGENPDEYYDDGEDDDNHGWDFVSQEEHPITGVPTFFLHPCQIEARMTLLEGSLTKEDVEEDNDQGISSLRHRRNGFILWAYMALLFPVLGHSIPSTCFQRVKVALTTRRNGDTKKN